MAKAVRFAINSGVTLTPQACDSSGNVIETLPVGATFTPLSGDAASIAIHLGAGGASDVRAIFELAL
jgi:hypothetical protein